MVTSVLMASVVFARSDNVGRSESVDFSHSDTVDTLNSLGTANKGRGQGETS